MLGSDGGGDWLVVQPERGGPVWVSVGFVDFLSGALTDVPVAATIPPPPTATPVSYTHLPGGLYFVGGLYGRLVGSGQWAVVSGPLSLSQSQSFFSRQSSVVSGLHSSFVIRNS